MTKNAAYTQTYFDLADELDGDIPSRRAAAAYMRTSSAIVHHRVIESTFIPRLFDRQTYTIMKNTAETTHLILCKVIEHYLNDPSYRRIFSFDPRLEELILLPRGYDSLLPFARIDIFLNEDTGDVAFCELNADGSAGLNENREVTNSIKDAATFRAFAQSHHVQGCNLFEPWVDTFMRIYDTFENKVAEPHIAICDYLENGVVDEFRVFAQIFEAHGIPCTLCDVRSLHFDGHVLTDDTGRRIDAIWRRCVTNDVITYWDESQDLINAVRAGRVALIGSFAGHLVHDKQIFEILFAPETHAFLTNDEVAFIKRSVPQTAFLADEAVDLEEIRTTKDNWIIKPTDHYGSDNVYAGCEVTQERWSELIDKFANSRVGFPFIVQRYIVPYRTKTLPPDTNIDMLNDNEVNRAPALYNNMSGLYLYDGNFQGVFSRLGPHETISKNNEGITAATIWVDADVDSTSGIELL